MRDAEIEHFRNIANSGNLDPWGQAYRVACGLSGPPRNVINGTTYANGHEGGLEAAMDSLLFGLCPDDDSNKDSAYHRQLRLLAACTPSGLDAAPLSVDIIGDIVGRLRKTAPGLDGVTARIIQHVWKAASSELSGVMGKCIGEGVFPDAWKDGRLLVLPKGNGKPLTDVRAYRPIILLPILGKILERVMLRCAPHIAKGMSDCQHGFTRGRSTTTALRAILKIARESTYKYVQAIFLDISGAFDNAWWPMILLKAKRGGCPPNIYRMLGDYFTHRRVGLFLGNRVRWKTSSMGCPQGSVLGPALWNLLLDDLLRLPAPEGVHMVAYADDVTVLIESQSRAGLEASASQTLRLVGDWGVRNRLCFSQSKSMTMTIKGKLKRPPVIKFGGNTVRTVTSATVLGLLVDAGLSFAQHASSIGERAANCFGKMSRISASSWGVRYRALKVLYHGTFVVTLTYAAAVWFERASLHVVRSALLRTQRPALVLLTKAYRSTSSVALPVLAGVLPADLEVIRAGSTEMAREAATREEMGGVKRTEEDAHHVLWECGLYADIRMKMIDGLVREIQGPVYYGDLVCSAANFCRLREFARAWHKIRSEYE